jgi:hypothetical protein
LKLNVAGQTRRNVDITEAEIHVTRHDDDVVIGVRDASRIFDK